MSNFEKANDLASEWVESMGGLDNISYRYDDDVSGLVQAIHDADLLMPDMQVIRTVEELEALDPDTVLIDSYGEEVFAYRMQVSIGGLGSESMYYDSFPAAVIATGDQVRATREAMEKENG